MRQLAELLRSSAAFALGPLVALVTAPVLAHALGPTGRGQLAAVLQPLTVADSLAAFGIPAATAYFVARGHDRHQLRRIAYRTAAVPAAIAYLALLAYGTALSPAQNISYGWLAGIWLAVIAGVVIAIRRAELAGGEFWRLLDGERALSAVGRLLAILSIAGLGVLSVEAFAVGPLVTGISASCILLFLVARRHLRGRDLPGKNVGPVPFLRYAASASIGSVAFALSARIDQLVLPLFIPSRELGFYVVGVTVSEVCLIFGMVLSRNLLAQTAARGLQGGVIKTLAIGMGMAAFAATCIIITSPRLIPFVFGEDFSPSVRIVQVLSIAAVFSVGTSALAAMLNGLGHPLWVSAGYLVPIVTFIGFVVVQHPSIDPAESATVMVVGQAGAFSLLLVIVLVLRRRLQRTA